jgi:hypothetical protein
LRPAIHSANWAPLMDFGSSSVAVAVVDVRQDAVGHVRAQLLVIGVGQLVVDDLGQHAFAARQLDQAVQLL